MAQSMLDHALAYAAQGFPVLPLHWKRDEQCSCGKPDCKWAAKHPIGSLAPHGSSNATTNREVIKEWWRVSPEANIGIATGPQAAIYVIDVDPDHGGNEAWDALVLENGMPTPTRTAITGSGGMHFYYRYPTWAKIPNGANLFEHSYGPGVDVRGIGGYVLAPPSQNMKGPYTWVEEEEDISEAPEWLIKLILDKTKSDGVQVPEMIMARGRNSVFTQIGGTMRRTGMGYDEILAALEVIRTTRTEQPVGDEFTHEELCKVVKHVCEYKPGNPVRARLTNDAPDGLNIRSLEEMSSNPPPVRKYLWEGLLTAGGTSNLVAKPKVGKSTFARALIKRIASFDDGQELFGRQLTTGSILYITIEDQEYEVLEHFRRMGMSDEAMRRVLVHCGRPPEPAHMAVKHLENAMQMVGEITGDLPILVVVDTLQHYARIKDINSYTNVTEAMAPYGHLARESMCHLMFLHHANRGDGEAGDNVMGSTAFFAGVDTLLDYRSKKGVRTICSVNRYGMPLEEISVTLDPVTGDLVAAGTYDHHLVNLAVASVLACIGDSVLYEAEIIERCDQHTREHVFKALQLMVTNGQLRQSGAGGRHDPHTYTAPAAVPLSSFPSFEQFDLPEEGIEI